MKLKSLAVGAVCAGMFAAGAGGLARADDAAPMKDAMPMKHTMPMKPKMMHRHYTRHHPMAHTMKPMMKDDKMTPDAPK